ncbi:hypothetical protein Pan44_30410 [Caulifigura coniformis]|uniref:Fructose-bisphosphate aldolase n=1 Tax=Caulifigura coniformis TaxID=2527983 RepID=A0A517SFX6_9PLAN|nr:hypothetical protein [Caulifigura coniformis]QDT55000.1 hypothetical protein Pan44_30410 [Caulifigura coniformis]
MKSKSLDRKLAAIHADPHGSREFLIADAKDADMAFGLRATGQLYDGGGKPTRSRTLAEYRDEMRAIVKQGLVDIMLMSNSTSEQLTLKERIFDHSTVTPAIRANDTTDIWLMRGSALGDKASRPFRSATINHARTGRIDDEHCDRISGANLGLYSITFANDRDRDWEALTAYAAFREEAERKRFRHFLEVFHPNVPGAVPAEEVVHFVSDAIVRTLAGVTSAGRPAFLKIPYPGPRALEDLVAYDPHLVVGVLGGSAGTTRDAFQLIHDARKHGARVALFGRKINEAESQLLFIQHLRDIVDNNLAPAEAVRSYHAALKTQSISSRRSLEDDSRITATSLSYS